MTTTAALRLRVALVVPRRGAASILIYYSASSRPDDIEKRIMTLTVEQSLRAHTLRALAAEKRKKRIERARRALEALQPGEYDDVMTNFCRSCGDNDPHCQCWNDE